MSNIAGYSNSFFGQQAGDSNTLGSSNSFFGQNAGYTNIAGSGNSFFGTDAGYYSTLGSFNSFFGIAAGYANTTGEYNSFFGFKAGYANTTGTGNSFIGTQVGWSNTTGSFNSFFGDAAGWANTTGYNNSFFGSEAGYCNNEGTSDSSFGVGSWLSQHHGYRQLVLRTIRRLVQRHRKQQRLHRRLLGRRDGIINATVIGYQAKVTQSNSLVLGSISGINGSTANVNVGIGTTAPQHRLHVVAATGYAGYFEGNVHVAGRFTFNSDARLKKDVKDLEYGLNEVMRLRPVSWLWWNRADDQRNLGLIAQEVKDVLPELVEQTQGGAMSLDYVSLIPVLTKAIQEQQGALERKDGEIAALKSQNAAPIPV